MSSHAGPRPRHGHCYNRSVSGAGRRQAGIAVLIILFAVAVALSQAPFELARIRLAGVNLLWWYALVVAPLVAALVAIPLLLEGRD